MYGTLVLIVCAMLYGGVLVVLYQRNADLAETVKGHEEHIRELEKYLNPTEKDSMIRSRLSTTETRVTTLDKALKAQAVDLDMVTKQMQSLLSNPNAVREQQNRPPVQNDEKIEGLSNQVNFVNERINSVASRVDTIVTAQNNLARKSVLMDNNVCVFSSADACPPRMYKAATFGIIAHNGPNEILPPGYFVGGPFNDNGWKWIHGGMCCMDQPPPQPQ